MTGKQLNGIWVPQPTTLARYGLTMREWRNMVEEQEYACGCCKKKPNSGKLFIDHEHVRGWKHMPSKNRKLYVRGLACYVCNRFILNHRVSAQLLRHGAEYLERFEMVRPAGEED